MSTFMNYDLSKGQNLTYAQKAHVARVQSVRNSRFERRAYVALQGFTAADQDTWVTPLSSVTAQVVYEVPRKERKANQLWMAQGKLTAKIIGQPVVEFRPNQRGWFDALFGPHRERHQLDDVVTDQAIFSPAKGSIVMQQTNRDATILLIPKHGSEPICLAVFSVKDIDKIKVRSMPVEANPGECWLMDVNAGNTVMTIDSPIAMRVGAFDKNRRPIMVPPERTSMNGRGDDTEVFERGMRIREISEDTPMTAHPVAAIYTPVTDESLSSMGLGFVPKDPERLFDSVHAKACDMTTPFAGVVTSVKELEHGLVEYTMLSGLSEHTFRLPKVAKVDLHIGQQLHEGDCIGSWVGRNGEKLRPGRRETIQRMADDLVRHHVMLTPETGFLAPAELVNPTACKRNEDGHPELFVAVNSAAYNYELNAVVLPAFDYQSQDQDTVVVGKSRFVQPAHAKAEGRDGIELGAVTDNEIARLLQYA